MQYWIRQREFDVQGPFPEEKIRRYVAQGRLRPEMWLSTDGETWRRAASFAELFPVTKSERTRPGRRETHRRVEQMRVKRKRSQLVFSIAAFSGLAVIAAVIFLARDGSAPDGEQQAQEPVGVYARSEHAVAVLGDGFGTGTGFLVAPGILATSAHVTERMFVHGIRVYFDTKSEEDATVLALLYEDRVRDLALLHVDWPGKPLPLHEASSVSRGSDLLVIGNPGIGNEILEKVVTRGLSGPVIEIEGAEYLQISASVNPGNSGGPVLNANGEVVAVIAMKHRDLEGVAFGVPVSVVRDALEAVERGRSGGDDLEVIHDARAAFWRLAGAGAVHLQIASACVRAGEEAAASDRSAAEVLAIIRRTAQDGVLEAGLDMKAVDERLKPLSRNAALDEGLRTRLVAFRNAVRELEVLNYQPPKSLAAYELELRRLHKVAERIRVALQDDFEALPGP